MLNWNIQIVMGNWREYVIIRGMVNIQHLRSFAMVCESDMNVSAAAKRLYSAQPAVSKHIARLEEHVGQPLFIRRGKRFLELTPIGREVLEQAREILLKLDNITALGMDQSEQPRGNLRVGTTHTQARYVLPPVVEAFTRECPQVALQIWQGAPSDLVRRMETNKADLVICTENLQDDPSLVSFPMFRWNRCLIAPKKHPLARARGVGLEQLAKHPIVTYVPGFTGRRAFDETFRRAGLRPNVVVSAADADVVKTYVRLGVGVGVIADIACDKAADRDLAVVSLGKLFPEMTTRLAHRREKHVTRAMRRFMDFFREQVGKNRKTGRRL